jgi:hypothetical protein
MTSPSSGRTWLAAGDLPPPWGGGAAPVFVSHVLLCDVRFTTARVRLANLIGAGWLTAVSAAAWARGLATLPGLWGRRDDPPAPPLARVCLLKPEAGTGIVTLPLRWETAGPDGGLIRVLNAGLTVMPTGPAQTVLRLDGVARLPYAAGRHHRSGEMRAHRAAAVCAGFLLTSVADALAGPARAGRPETGGMPVTGRSWCRGSSGPAWSRPAVPAARQSGQAPTSQPPPLTGRRGRQPTSLVRVTPVSGGTDLRVIA